MNNIETLERVRSRVSPAGAPLSRKVFLENFLLLDIDIHQYVYMTDSVVRPSDANRVQHIYTYIRTACARCHFHRVKTSRVCRYSKTREHICRERNICLHVLELRLRNPKLHF